jgi:hypothetical protein
LGLAVFSTGSLSHGIFERCSLVNLDKNSGKRDENPLNQLSVKDASLVHSKAEGANMPQSR